VAAKASNPEHFPIQYFNILHVVGEQGKTWRVPGVGEMQPMVDSQTGEEITADKLLSKLRGHFYAFKGSLKKFKDDPKFQDSYLASCRVACYVDRKGKFVEFRPTDKTWHAQALASGGIVGGDQLPANSPIVSAEEESLKKLEGLLNLESGVE
jgi:hypothetical protein